MATENILVRLAMNASDYVSGANKAARATNEITGAAEKTESGARRLAAQYGGLAKAAAGAFVASKAVSFAKDSVAAFSNLEESINAVKVGFGEGAAAILHFGETAATEVGLANSEFNQLSVTTGALLSNFIDDEQQVAAETIKLTKRAADMASVFNTSVPDALNATQAAIRGEMEPIRRFGVMLDDATIRSHAVEMGLAATTKEVDRQAKGVAALDLIYQQTNKTAGDFVNTSDGLANKQRILTARFEDTKAAVGASLAPAMEALLDLGMDLLPVLEGLGPAIADFVVGAGAVVSWFAGIPAITSPAVLGIGGVTAALGLLYAHPVIAGLAAVAAAVMLIGKNAAGDREDVQTLTDEIRTLGEVTSETIASVVENQNSSIAKALSELGFSADEIRSHLGDSESDFNDWLDTVDATFTDAEGVYARMSEAAIEELGHLRNMHQDATMHWIPAFADAATDAADGVVAAAVRILQEGGEPVAEIGRIAKRAGGKFRRDLSPGVDDASASFQTLNEKVRESIDIQREAVNPAFRLRRANERLAEATLAAAEATGEDLTGALFDLMEAELDQRAAAAAVGEDTYDAFIEAAMGIGRSREQAQKLAEELGLMPRDTNLRINIHTGYTSSGSPPSIPEGSTGGRTTVTVPEPRYAEGGDFTANQPIMVGELGPEILVPSMAGSIIPNSQVGGGGGTTNIYMEGGGDVYDDVSLALAMSGITESIEWAGTSTLR